MSKFWDELGNEHKEKLETEGLSNFRKYVAPRYFTDLRKENEQAIRELYNMASILGADIVEDPGIGGPVLVNIDGKMVSQDMLTASIEAHSIPFDDIQSVVEFGAGYGRTAYAILKNHPELKYTIVDVPPAIDLSKEFLSKALPGNSVEFVSPETIPSADLYIAISVFSELTPEEVNRYMDVRGKLFYIKDWKEWHNPVDDVTIGTERYKNLDAVFERDDLVTKGFFEALYKL